MNQIGRQCGQLFDFIPGEAIFDRDVLTLGKACVFQTLTDRGQEVRGVAGPLGGEEPDHRQRRLLRARPERPGDSRAAEQRDELTPLHSITSSARASSVCGTSRSRALAVLRLMTSSNLVEDCTGKPCVAAPRRIRSTYVAVR